MAKITHSEILRRRLEMRRLLRQEADKPEIIQLLQRRGFVSSPRTYDRDWAAIREDDQQWIQNQAKGEFVTDYRRAIEVLREQVRYHHVTRSKVMEVIEAAKESREVRGRDRAALFNQVIRATDSIAEIETQIVDLLAMGPVVFGVKADWQRVQTVNA